MEQSRWWNYVRDVIGDTTAKDVADHVGIDKSNVTRWKQGSKPAVEFVLKFARAYGVNVLNALVEAGFITNEEAGTLEVQIGKTAAISKASSAELLEELLRRAQRETSDALD